VTRVIGWFTELPYGQSNIGTNQTEYADAIIDACTEFGPPDSEDQTGWAADWQEYCQAILTAAILKESSYNSTEVVVDAYATQDGSNDPTVGLLQVRFSSTVHDYAYYGPLAKMAAVGCAFPDFSAYANGDTTFWRGQGGTAQYTTFMESIPCNVALAAWYYFTNATGNGGSTTVYAAQYCSGGGAAGDVVIGLLSHLLGPAGAHPPDPTNAYVTFIKQWFTTFIGGTLPTPDPFMVTLSPMVSQYCQ
jgi:hypothetical protein